MDGLRRAGLFDYLPRGLLARAWLHSLTDDTDAANTDLNEAQEIAERDPMPFHLALLDRRRGGKHASAERLHRLLVW